MEASQPSSLLQPINHVELLSPKAAAAPLPENPGPPKPPAAPDASGGAETDSEVTVQPDNAAAAPTSVDVFPKLARITGR